MERLMHVLCLKSFKLLICFVFEKGESTVSLPQRLCERHCLGSKGLSLVLGNSDPNWHYTLFV